jgi:hypothetical protein
MRSLLEFFFPTQLTRLPYFIRTLLVNAILAYLYSGVESFSANQIIGIVAAVIYWAGFIALPRMRDIGMSPGWLIVALIPGVNWFLAVILLFRRSDLHKNPLLRATPTSNPTQPPASAAS